MIRAALIALLATAACAGEEVPFGPDAEQEDLVEVIEYRMPESPLALDVGEEPVRATIAFGHCDPPTTNEDGSTNINCPQKWSEIAWYRIEREEVETLLGDSNDQIEFHLGISDSTIPEDTLRFAIHEISEDGTTRKVLRNLNFADGATETLALDAKAYNIYVARGENRQLVWANGTIEFQIASSPVSSADSSEDL